MRELAFNLNAAMGFGAIRYEVTRCPALAIRVSGVAPGAAVEVYWGSSVASARLVVAGLRGVARISAGTAPRLWCWR